MGGLGNGGKKPMEHWLEPVFESAMDGVAYRGGQSPEWAQAQTGFVTLFGFSAFAIGTALAWWMYIAKKGEPARQLAAAMPGLHRAALNKWYVDEAYDATVIAGVDSVAESCAAVDTYIVDGLLAKVTSLLVAAAGTVLRALQTGLVHTYSATMVVGVAALAWFFAMPHPDATVTAAGSDDYVVTAAPGLGYSYRWDSDGDGKADTTEFAPEPTLKIRVEAGKTTRVGLEVKNAFGLVSKQTIPVTHPAAALSSL
jgi:NADH-quinone oxidoreductase subunit L